LIDSVILMSNRLVLYILFLFIYFVY